MKSFQDIIKRFKAAESTYDAHFHAFDQTESTIKTPFQKHVCFMDIEFDDNNLDPVSAYNRYIENDWSEKDILLCTATNIEDIKKIWNEYNDKLYGFGELKLYDEYMGGKVPYKKISFLKEVCKFSSECGNLPVFFHWDANSSKDIKKISKVLAEFPRVPLVWCHCGMNDNDLDYVYNEMVRLMRMYGNLWCDISYSSLHYFENFVDTKLHNMVLDRVIVGSDFNCKLFGPSHNDEERELILYKMNRIRRVVNSDYNVEKLFNLRTPK